MMNLPRTVAELMSKDVLSLSEDQDLQHLEEVMRLFKFRHMPVTEDGLLVGLITQRDVLRMSGSSLLPAARQQTEHLTKAFRVGDVMVQNVRTVRPETPLLTAAKVLHQEKVGCLPVVDAHNVLVGILTEADFVRFALDLLSEEDSP